MKKSGIVVAIGGGGFTHQCDPDLDEFCLQFLPLRPSIGFVGMASGDSTEKTERFYDRFRGQAGTLSHLCQDASRTDVEDWLAGKDMVYFGGGNSATLIRQLQTRHLAALFQRANAQGLVLAGVSAGGVCWFDWAFSDAGGKGYAPLKGLGLVKSGICPHYLDEPARRPPFEILIAQNAPLDGYGVDDGACVVAQEGRVTGAFSARDGSAAYHVSATIASGISVQSVTEFS